MVTTANESFCLRSSFEGVRTWPCFGAIRGFETSPTVSFRICGKEWFKKAMAINEKAVQPAAIHDPDLKPLWDSMSGTIWKRE